MIRIGHGYDAHRFADDALLHAAESFPAGDAFPDDEAFEEDALLASESIVIGGVTIPYVTTLIAHSDGDVLVHALCDALLGALALGDIGKHFPDTASEFENIDSRILLRKVMQEVQKSGYQVSNVDMTIIAQAPKMAAHIETMCSNLADDMAVSRTQVNVKATTTEKMGFTGRKEGIAAHAVVLLANN
jgi:2-C-methyl-D-erythritol 2,4-cyclodiphosphate synthase